MTSPKIDDLPLNEELDSSAMAAVQGGRAIAPGVALATVLAGPKLPPALDPVGPYGVNGFVLPEGAID